MDNGLDAPQTAMAISAPSLLKTHGYVGTSKINWMNHMKRADSLRTKRGISEGIDVGISTL